MSNANEKRQAGEAAIRYVEDGAIIGVGTGSTVAFSSTRWPICATASRARCRVPSSPPHI
jgi:ribose 5-phosphate isomerase